MRGGGGGRLGDGVKTALGLGREEGLTVPTPPGPRPRDTLVAGVGGLIDDEEADEAGGLPEVLLLGSMRKINVTSHIQVYTLSKI